MESGSFQVDALLAQSDKELDSTKRMDIYKQVDKLYIDTYCANIPLFWDPGYQAISPDVGYWNFQNPQNAKFAPQDAWLKK